MHLHSHVPRILPRSVTNVTDGQGGGTDQDDLVEKRIRWSGSLYDIGHGIVRVGVIWTGVIDKSGAIARRPQKMTPEFHSLQTILGDIGHDLLVRNFFVLANHLQRQRRKEILILVADH